MFGKATAVGGKRHRLVRVYGTVEEAREGARKVHAEALAYPKGEVVPVKGTTCKRRDGNVVVVLEYDVWRGM